MSIRSVALACVLCGLSGVGLALAEPAADEAVRKEWAKLEGTWELVLPEGAKDAGMRFEFKGRKVTVTWVGDGSLDAEVTLYPDTDPKCIDIEFKKVRREHYEGVYRVEGDSLRLALAPSDVKNRPTSVPDKTEKGDGFIHAVFKRQKP